MPDDDHVIVTNHVPSIRRFYACVYMYTVLFICRMYEYYCMHTYVYIYHTYTKCLYVWCMNIIVCMHMHIFTTRIRGVYACAFGASTPAVLEAYAGMYTRFYAFDVTSSPFGFLYVVTWTYFVTDFTPLVYY